MGSGTRPGPAHYPRRSLPGRTRPVGSQAFDIAAGERTNLEQYSLAIRSAQRAIYIENQYLDIPDIVQALHETLERGVKVVALVPGVPVLMARETTSEGRAFFETRATLGDAVYNI